MPSCVLTFNSSCMTSCDMSHDVLCHDNVGLHMIPYLCLFDWSQDSNVLIWFFFRSWLLHLRDQMMSRYPSTCRIARKSWNNSYQLRAFWKVTVQRKSLQCRQWWRRAQHTTAQHRNYRCHRHLLPYPLQVSLSHPHLLLFLLLLQLLRGRVFSKEARRAYRATDPKVGPCVKCLQQTNHVSDSLTNIMCLTTCPDSLSKNV